jgi:hypothetical protein
MVRFFYETISWISIKFGSHGEMYLGSYRSSTTPTLNEGHIFSEMRFIVHKIVI